MDCHTQETDPANLPEECVATMLSLTSPRDACRLAAVSSTFRSAADSDVVWARFLPSDYPSLLSRAVHPLTFDSKRDLFFLLSARPLLIDRAKMVRASSNLRLNRLFLSFFRYSPKAQNTIVGVPPVYGWWFQGIRAVKSTLYQNWIFKEPRLI